MIDLDINSMYAHQMNPDLIKVKPFKILESSPDSSGTMWYEISVHVTSLQRWIESQSDELWCDATYSWGSKNKGIPYLIHESLFTYITLRWS